MTGTASEINHTGGSSEAGAPCYHCQQPKPGAEQAPVRIRVAVFFDGTLNNRTNTGLGEQGGNRGTSYKNALTNIAILELYYQKDAGYDYSFSYYIEGIATEDGESDSLVSAGIGMGATGILGKVEKGISRILEKICKTYKRSEEIECLHLDCFGFSRGAAAARNFTHSALLGKQSSLEIGLQARGHHVSEIKVKFVGLYDTVASYGLLHSNDTADLHLDAIRHAEYVVQLAAAEEHRKHFPLTNINSAPHGIQLFLPGAHSDVGGGYVDNDDEVDHLIMFIFRKNGLSNADKAALIRERDWILTKGWYCKDEVQEGELWNSVKVTRRAISNHFHRVPLKMMAEHAANRGVNFLTTLMTQYPITPQLLEVEALITKSPLSSPQYWLDLNTEIIKKLRHDYLHFSACFGSHLGCNDPQFTDNNLVSGSREREVLDG